VHKDVLVNYLVGDAGRGVTGLMAEAMALDIVAPEVRAAPSFGPMVVAGAAALGVAAGLGLAELLRRR